jgi:hypothetical protein
LLGVTKLIQNEIVEWLKDIKEMQAVAWFETYWTGEFGNHTNATAGYVGFNKPLALKGTGDACGVTQSAIAVPTSKFH